MHFLKVTGMPRRILDYLDPYLISIEWLCRRSYILALSSLFFLYVGFEALSSSIKKTTPIYNT